MTTNKYMFLVIILLCSVALHVIHVRSVQAQNEFNRRIVFQPYGDQTFVSLDNFPQVEMRFLIQENGKHLKGQFESRNFKIFEDGWEITPVHHAIESLPIYTSVVIDVESDQYLPEEDPTRDLWGQLVWDITKSDSFQLCFTIGLPSCESKRDRTQFDVFFESMRQGIIEQPLNERSPLSLILNQALTEADAAHQTPVIILIRDISVNSDSPPDIPDEFLSRVQAQGGVFILIDETINPAYRQEFADYLEKKGAYYYPAYGVPDGTLCEKVSDCVYDLISNIRPAQHIIRFQSRSFPDNLPHELVVEFREGDGANRISATTAFSFGGIRATSSINPIFRNANSILAVFTPFFLMLILVFSVQPRNSKT